MEGQYHFDSTPIAPSGSAMLMQKKPANRTTLGLNAKKACYMGPCFNHFRSFWGMLPLTKGERISDTVKFQNYAIAMPELTPVDRTLEATRQLSDAINQQPKRAPMDKITAIDMLRKVMLGERRTKLPENSLQMKKSRNKKRRETNDSHASIRSTAMTSMPPSTVATIQELQSENPE